MIPVFPSITFPNHYSIVTGLYPESHGMIANSFYDSVKNDTFQYWVNAKNTDPYWWEQGTPLWVSAIQQGKKAASIFWPGSEAPNKVSLFQKLERFLFSIYV
jgi:predicted AlkP superfamily pyrophosphatase or phosphodiesterase